MNNECESFLEVTIMSLRTKRALIIAIIVVAAFVIGRLSVRAVMNLLLGGTMFGGNIL